MRAVFSDLVIGTSVVTDFLRGGLIPSTIDVLEECRQYEPEYRNETRFYLDSINKLDFEVYSSGTFRFRKFSSLNDFINFYNENSNKYIIIDEYNREFTLDEFLEDINLK